MPVPAWGAVRTLQQDSCACPAVRLHSLALIAPAGLEPD